ncbi:MAG: VCBS repeat-containing protein [Phycisphaerales bacterium]|nr:MAG: VCBS repeat-containing protein [Phycisphaerales bacterium]
MCKLSCFSSVILCCMIAVVQSTASGQVVYEVWGGNTDYRGLPAWYAYYYSIDQQDYTKLGESDGQTETFSGTYQFYVIAARQEFLLDAIQGSTGLYYQGSGATGNTTSPENISGAPDGQYATVGYQSSGGTFRGFVVIEVALGSWTGLTVIGTVPGPPAQYTLTVTTQGNGSVELSDPCAPYDEWTEVGMAAISDYGWQFDHWEGDYTGSENPGWILMDGNKSVKAVFTALTSDYLVRGRYYMFQGVGKSGLRHAYQALQAGMDDPGYTKTRELRFLYALARGAVFVIDNEDVAVDSLLELAEQFGVEFLGDYFIDVNAPFDESGCYQMPVDAPDLDDIYSFVSGTAIPEIDAIVAELDLISDSPGDRFRIYLTPAETGLSENLEVDYGDLLVMRTLLLALRAHLQGQLAYDQYIDPGGTLFSELICGQVPEPFSINDYILDPHPHLWTVLPTPWRSTDGAAALAQAKQDWLDAIAAYLAAYNYIVNEDNPPGTDPQDNELLYLDPNDQPFVENWCNSRLTTLRDSLQNDSVVSYPAETTVTYDLYAYGGGPAVGDMTLVYDFSAVHGEISGTDYGPPSSAFQGEFWRHGRGINLELWYPQAFYGYFRLDGEFNPDDSSVYFDDATLRGDRVSTEVVNENVDLNPLYGSDRYTNPVSIRDLFPSFDGQNMPVRDTFGHGLGDDATLGGVFPDMTQDDWWELLTGYLGLDRSLVDFDGDGRSDLLWRRASTGAYFVALMEGGVPGPYQYVGGGGDFDLQIVRVGDCDGNGTTDLLWRRASTSAHFVTLMTGGVPGPYQYVGGGGDPDLELAGVGDCDGNGTTDLLWHRTSTSANFVTLMTGGVPGPYQYVGGGGDPDLGIVALGDCDGSGTTDLLWHRTSTSANFVTLMTGGVPGGFQYVGGGGDPDLEITNLGDCDGNGTKDLLWHRTSTSANFVTLMTGGVPGAFQYVGGGGDPDLQIVGLGDYDGSGATDLLWHRTSTSANFVTLMTGGVPGAYQYVGGGGDPDLQIVGVGDWDGNGTTDLLWHRTSTGASFVTLMTGGVPGPYQYVGGGGDPDIQIINLE